MLFGELVCLLLRSPLPLYKPTWYCFLYRRGVDPPGIRAGIPQGAAEARMAEMRGRRTTEEVGFWGGLVSLHPLGSLWSAVSSLSGVWGGHKHTLVHSERRKCARARRYREVMENPFPWANLDASCIHSPCRRPCCIVVSAVNIVIASCLFGWFQHDSFWTVQDTSSNNSGSLTTPAIFQLSGA